eukprot:TRINITY_DN345_c1_g1_i11.p1 TRINITY_DN345_c1_g1~~TRINITY_DN345_c1_g1_i11.p1  ORF type:complete len:423 (+),score=17.74 TRINITY_DN345_c1_g1_i11:159-1271(+)
MVSPRLTEYGQQNLKKLTGKLKNNDFLKAIILGQFLSVIIASTAICSTALVRRGVNVPTTQSFFNYFLLALTMGILRLRSRAPLPPRWPFYAIIGLLDVEANFLLVKAYQYTSITSVTLLDCFSLPCVMVLSFFFLKARYRLGHALGGSLCVLGLAFLILMDHHGEGAGPNPILGDMLVLIGATVYGICNVTQERLLRESTVQDFLLLVGMFGLVWSGIQVSIFERAALATALQSNASVFFLLAGFAVSLFLFYCLVPFVLKWSGSAILNLSLLSSDLWAALARMAFFGGFSALTAGAFGGSLLLVTIGLIIYAKSGDVYKVQDVQYVKFDEQQQQNVIGEDDMEIEVQELITQSNLQGQLCEMQSDKQF